MKNMDDKQLILKVALATEKSRNKAKKISENFEIGELVLISNHTKVLNVPTCTPTPPLRGYM